MIALPWKSTLMIFVVILLHNSPLCAQPNSDTSISRARIDKYYISSYLKDYKTLALSPFKPSVAKYVGMAAFATSTYLLVHTYDAKIQRFAQENRSTDADNISKHVFERVGSGVYSIPTVLMFYAHGLAFKNQKSKKVAMNATKSFLITGSLVYVAKISFQRQRPLVGPPDPHRWFTGNGDRSFFSGHTATAFSIATVIAEEYRNTVWVPILCYVAATGAGLSRIYDNKHWASDVLTGAAAGYVIGRLVVRTNNWGIKIVPRIIIAP